LLIKYSQWNLINAYSYVSNADDYVGLQTLPKELEICIFSLYQNVKKDVSAMILYPRFKAVKLTGHERCCRNCDSKMDADEESVLTLELQLQVSSSLRSETARSLCTAG